MRVLRELHEETVYATTAGVECKEVLLFPKTLDVNVVPALDCFEQLTTMGCTSTSDCLQQAMKFNSLRAYHGSCRLRRFGIEDLATLPSSEPCDILRNISPKGRQVEENNSVHPAPTDWQAKQTFCPADQNMSINMTSEEDNQYDDVLPYGPPATPPTPSVQKIQEDNLMEEQPRTPAKTENQVDCTDEMPIMLTALSLGPTSLSVNDLCSSITSEDDDSKYDEVLLSRPPALPPKPNLQKIKQNYSSMQEQSSTPTKTENQVNCTDEMPITLPLPLGPRSLSANDLSRNITSEEDGNMYVEFLCDDPPALPPKPSLYKTVDRTSDTRSMHLRWKSLSECDLHELMAPDDGNVDKNKTHSLPPNPRKEIIERVPIPRTHPRVPRQTDKPLPLPPRGKRPSEGKRPDGMKKTALDSPHSDEDENGYTAMSRDVGDSEYTEMGYKVFKDDGTAVEELVTEELKEARSTAEGPEEFPVRSGSYWYAYQHFGFRQFHQAGLLGSASYVDRPVLPPRRRQHSDITDKTKTKWMESEEEGDKKVVYDKKSCSEGDVFQNVSLQNYIDFFARIDPDGTYLEPMEEFSGAAELQVDNRDTNYKRMTIGEEGQESHEGRISRDSSEEEDDYGGRERCATYSYPYLDMLYPFLRGVEHISDGTSVHTDNREKNTMECNTLSSGPFHIDNQNHGGPTVLDKTTVLAKEKEEHSPSSSTGISCQAPFPPRKPDEEENSEVALGEREGSFPCVFAPYYKSQAMNDLCAETADHQGDVKNVEEKEDENLDDPSNEEYDHGLSSSTIISAGGKKPKDHGKKARVNEKDKAPRLQKAWAQHQRIRRKMGSSSGNQEEFDCPRFAEKNVSTNVDPPKTQKKNTQEAEAKLAKNQESENREKRAPIPQEQPEFDSRTQKRRHHKQEFQDDTPRFFKTKDKKTLVNAKFEAELSRVMNIRAEHICRAQHTWGTSKDACADTSFGTKSPPPSPSTETSPRIEKSTRDRGSCPPKSKKKLVPIPKRNGK